MSTPKRYGVFCKRTHAEVHGHGATTNEEMEQWIKDSHGPQFYYVGIVQMEEHEHDLPDIVRVAA